MFNLDRVKKLALERDCKVLENEPMKKYTTFKIGGNAQMLIIADTLRGLTSVLKECTDENISVFILGNGSDLLVSDKGISGVVIKLGREFSSISLVDDDTIFCGAGVSLAKLTAFACDNSLSGLEFAWGIPGSAGGAAYMNAGAYGGEMKDVLVQCMHIDRNGVRGQFSADELKFAYRKSVYTDNDLIITGLVLKLNRDSQTEIRARMDDYMNRRKLKQPLEYPSAGSVFKRPEGYFAGALIEEAGLKGVSVGGAQVSEKHCGFIVNKGNATSEDVFALVKKIKDEVKKNSGVELECEIKAIG